MNNTLSTTEELYATVPMNAVRFPTPVRSDEEEIYTSFEQALSTRLMVYENRVRSSDRIHVLKRASCQTGPIVHNPRSLSSMKAFSQRKQTNETTALLSAVRLTKRNLLLICFAFMCTLAGFDLMGLLILHMR